MPAPHCTSATQAAAARKKPRTLTPQQMQVLARRAIVDEFGDLTRALEPHKAALARLEALKKTIRAWYLDEEATESFSAQGDHYEATVGPKGNQTTIDNKQDVYAAMGHACFLEACSMAIGTLETTLTPARAAAFVSVAQTGPRSLAVRELNDDDE